MQSMKDDAPDSALKVTKAIIDGEQHAGHPSGCENCCGGESCCRCPVCQSTEWVHTQAIWCGMSHLCFRCDEGF